MASAVINSGIATRQRTWTLKWYNNGSVAMPGNNRRLTIAQAMIGAQVRRIKKSMRREMPSPRLGIRPSFCWM
jgi:hypothetical protein